MITAPSNGPPRALPPHGAVVDVELTSRCNAHCAFCPRDQTQHLGFIDDETFTAALQRVVQYRDALLAFGKLHPGYFDTSGDSIWMSFCGMGEPLLHPQAATYVKRAAEAGLRPIVNTNGALLSPTKAEHLLDAGLEMAVINVGEIGDDYEAVYGLPFERTRANVEHFLTLAKGRCSVVIALVDYRDDQEHATRMREYWTERGATAFLPFPLVNRAGALAVEQQTAAWVTHRPQARSALQATGDDTNCWVPFLYPFIGYDGNYYLCSSDWRKEVSLGNVFERSLVDVLDDKAEHVCSRSAICSGCTHDPANALALALSLAEEGDVETTLAKESDRLRSELDHNWACAAAMRTDMPKPTTNLVQTKRKRIPVRS